jgi:hypothetical protein
MRIGGEKPWHLLGIRKAQWLAPVLTFALFFALLQGCARPRPKISGEMRPSNVFRSSPVLPGDIKRVAMMPLTAPNAGADQAYAARALQQVLASELIKTRKFEVQAADPGLLRIKTGAPFWTASDPLPLSLFDLVTNDMACEAVLFPEVTHFQAYPKLIIGWRLRLINASDGFTLWAADEIYDASDLKCLTWAVSVSPQLFGEASAEAILATLPLR